MKNKCIISSIILIFLILVIIIIFVIYKKTINISVADVELDIENNNESQEVNYGWEWKYDTPENYGINSNDINSLYNRYDFSQVYSTVIIKNDHIINEYYKDGYDKNSIFTLQSCSKSITSALIGIAIDKGYIKDVNVNISEYFPQIENYNNEYLKDITIWHLLTHTSGLNISDDAIWYEWRASDNWVDFALSQPSIAPPGQVFDYSTAGTHLLAAILEKATGKSLYEFGKENLFDLIGMSSVQCETDPQGVGDGGNGFSMTPYDMAKFGRLYLNGGNWEGKQIISKEYIEESIKIQYDRSSGYADYGYQWWIDEYVQNGYTAFWAQGFGGQYIYVVPQLDLIVIFTSNRDNAINYQGRNSVYWQFMDDLVDIFD